jgi:hypothetical protein
VSHALEPEVEAAVGLDRRAIVGAGPAGHKGEQGAVEELRFHPRDVSDAAGAGTLPFGQLSKISMVDLQTTRFS